MATRWSRFYEQQVQDPELRELVEKELESLNVGIQIARIRQQEGLTQTQLAARARMSAPKISLLETAPKDAKLSTIIRIAHALERRVKLQLAPNKRRRGAHARRVRSAPTR